MLKAKVGYSRLKEGYDCGVETATRALDGLKQPNIGIIYTSSLCEEKQVLKGIQEKMKNTPIIGATSVEGMIIPDGVISGEEHFAGMLALEDEESAVGVAIIAHKKGDARKLGQKLALDAIEDSKTGQIPNYFYMIASAKEEEEYLKGIQDIIGRVPFFGGSIGENKEKTAKIFCNQTIIKDGCAVAFFYTDSIMETEYTSPYQETQNKGLITKVKEKRTLVEIDGEPALKKLAHWIDEQPKDLMEQELKVRTILNPLGIKSATGDAIQIYHPLIGKNDLSMTMGNKISEGVAVISMQSTVDEVINSIKQTLQKTKTKIDVKSACYLLICDENLKTATQEQIQAIYKNIKGIAKTTPFLMAFSSAEYGYQEHNANAVGNLMLSFTAISEK